MAELTVRCYVSIGGAPEIPTEEMTVQQREEIGVRLRDRMAEAIRQYYGEHPEEWEAMG